jgi:hypothetical protein
MDNKRQSETEAWFRNRVARSQHSVFTEIVDITPELAAIFLRKNDGNRSLKPVGMARLIDDIENEKWRLNGESIIIAKDGSLNDGQNRCHAVILVGKPIKSVVTFGVERDTRYTCDQGIVKTTGDLATMFGIENGRESATLASYIFSYKKVGAIFQRGSAAQGRPTRTQIFEIFETHPEIESAVKRTARNCPGGRTVGAFCRWAIECRVGKSGQSYVDAFFDQLVSGANLMEGDPILVARNSLLKRDTRYYANERTQIILFAWNDYRSGRLRKAIKVSNDHLAKLPEIRK